MKKEKYFLRNFKFNAYSSTIRAYPQNYWIATVYSDGSIEFNSWDGAIKGRYSKIYVWLLWHLGLIPNDK
jgi:hypothetical protein